MLNAPAKHTNNGVCRKCAEIFEVYPGFNEKLKAWFISFQAAHPESHISCAGRGRVEQERDFQKGASKAHYGQSAHNYGCAIDLFVLLPGEEGLYPKQWFFEVLAPELAKQPWLDWGYSWTRFPEMPHVELANWHELVELGFVGLVEPLEGSVG